VTVGCIQNGMSDVLANDRRSFSGELRTKCRRSPPLTAAATAQPPSTPRPSRVNPAAADITGLPGLGSLDRRRDEMDAGGGGAQPARYKTELCRGYREHGRCRYGDRCQFAHGPGELRRLARHPKYKTDLCRTYHSTGLCPYGPRCHFIHDEHGQLGLLAPLGLSQAAASASPKSGQRTGVISSPSAVPRWSVVPPVGSAVLQSPADDDERQLRLLALLDLYRRQASVVDGREFSPPAAFHSPPSSKYAATASLVAAPGWSVPPECVPAVLRSPARPIVASSASVGCDSAASSPDPSPPPSRTPRGAAADQGSWQRQQVDRLAASSDRLTALLVLAARRRLLHAGNTAAAAAAPASHVS